jgi:hypothetical protein
MLLFRSEETVRAWCEQHAIPQRPVLSLDQVWVLAKAWYANRMTPESRRPAGDEIAKIFAGISLEGEFWNLESDQWSG